MSAEQSTNQGVQPSVNPMAGTEPDASGEQALSFLSNIEKQFGELKRLTGESARRAQELDQRESTLRADAERMARELAAAVERAGAAERQAEQARSANDEATQRADRLSGELEEVRARLEEAMRQSQAHASAVAGLEKQIESLRAQHDQAIARQHEQLTSDHTAAMRRAEAAAEESQRRIEMLERSGQTADLARRELESRLATLQAELVAAKQAMTQAQARAAELTDAVERSRAEAEQARSAMGEMEKRMAAAAAKAEEATAVAGQRAAEAASAIARAEQAERDAAASAARLSCSAGEHGEALRSAGEEIEGLRRLIDTLRGEAGQVSGERDILDAKVKELTAELESVREAQNQAAQAGLTSGAEADKARQALAQREEALRVLAGRLLNAEERLLAAENDKTTLASETASARKEAAELREVIEQGGGAPVFTGGAGVRIDDGFAALRRERLARYKALLAEQSHKIVQAKAALGKKTEQANEAIALRARLAEQMQLVAAERQRVQKSSARSSAAVMLLCFFGVLAIVGALSWAVANQIAPATYAARAVIAADTPGRAPTQDEMLAWTAAHEKLLEEPDFMTLAAERFGQRGMATLGSPAAVKMRLKSDISLHTDKAGALTIELRGRGMERTERELETIALALVAMANSHRDARGDGAATVLSEVPKAGSEPLEDPRLVYVAGIGGGGAAVAVVLFLGMYRVVVRSKRKFEQQMLMIENE